MSDRLRPDASHTIFRAGDKFVYTFTYYLSDGTTASSPTDFVAVVRQPDGSVVTHSSSPDVTGATNEWTVAIDLDVPGDWFVEAIATWTDDKQSELHYIHVSQSLISALVEERAFSSAFSSAFG